ncbi:MAG TPA: tetratricopeptide repeat protein [Gammaproteobacteria bacterium]|nr:tetratricopeptide repeat protein [Gammaproteobacteria bacterium]
MSLINQMLRDLEARDGKDERSGMLHDLAWSAAGGGRGPLPGRRLARGLGLVALLSATAVLAWQVVAHRSVDAPAARAVAATPMTEAVTEPVAAPVATPAPMVVASAPRPQPRAIPATPPVASVAEPEVATPAAAEAEPDDTPAPRVKVFKQARPLSGAEQAARYYQQGYDYILSQHYAEAETVLRRALAADAAHIQAREMLVGQLIRRGELGEAGELLREGLSLAPRHARFAKLYARLLVEQNAVPTAIHILQTARPALAQDPEYHALLAALYQRQGNHRAAAGIYRELVRLRGDIAVWWVGLAVSLESLGKPAEARVAYARAGRLPRLAANLRQYIETRLAALGGAGS